MSKSETTAVVGDRWTPKTLMDACMHIRSLEAEIRELRSAMVATKFEALGKARSAIDGILRGRRAGWDQALASVRDMIDG